MPEQASPHVTEAILEIVEIQIRDEDPPETKITIERLQGCGIPRTEAVRLVACLVVDEMHQILKTATTFDKKRYVSNLNKLPNLPWD